MPRAWIAGGFTIALVMGLAGGYAIGEVARCRGCGESRRDNQCYLLATGEHFEGEFERAWAVKAFLETPSLDTEIERVIAGDGVLAVMWRATGTGARGREFDLPGVNVHKLEGELIR